MERLMKIVLAVGMIALCTILLTMCVAGVYALARWMMGA